jgi:hypothetical protein
MKPQEMPDKSKQLDGFAGKQISQPAIAGKRRQARRQASVGKAKKPRMTGLS